MRAVRDGGDARPTGQAPDLTERPEVTETASLTSTVAGRYANALFELAREADALDAVEADVEALAAALGESEDLSTLITSPLYSREDQGKALKAVTGAMGLGTLTANVAGLMAEKRRLFALPDVLDVFRQLLAEHRGEVTAEVTSAKPLSETQAEALKDRLAKATGRTIKLSTSVDEALIGGLVVKVGSRMIDSSIRARLSALETAMKEVG